MFSFLFTTTKRLALVLAVAGAFAVSAHAQIDPTSPAQIKWSLIVNAGAPTAPCPTSTVPSGTPYWDSTNHKGYHCDPSGWVADSSSSGGGLQSCADSSGSGTAQVCSTSPTFTPTANQSCVVYTTTTANTGTGLTVNVNSMGAKSVAIAGSSGWTTTLTSGVIPTNKPLAMCYDGTNWDVLQTGTAAAGGGGSPGTPAGTIQVYKDSTHFGGTATWVAAAGINGFACDHTTDDTGAFNTLLSTITTAGGGTISWQCNALLNSAEITFPNTGGTTPTQVNIRITGLEQSANGQWGAPPNITDSRMDLQFNATDAKLVTLGIGQLEIDHMNIVDGGSDCAAFFLTTNTTVSLHDNLWSGTASGTSACNDAIVLGGTTTTSGGTVSSAFQGYHSTIENNFFDKIRRGAWLRVFANAIRFAHNTWSKTCGATSSEAAVQFTPGSTGGFSWGNVFEGNLFEVSNYPYVIALDRSSNGNQFFGDSYWDSTVTTLKIFHVTNSAANNYADIFADTTFPSPNTKLADDNQPDGSNSFNDQNWEMGIGLAAAQGRRCAGSGSGTAQTCSTAISFTPTQTSWIQFIATTANTGTGFTINVNGIGVKSVAKLSGGASTTTLAANDVCANVPLPMYYDGTNWVMVATCNGTGGSSTPAFYYDSFLYADGALPSPWTANTAGNNGCAVAASQVKFNSGGCDMFYNQTFANNQKATITIGALPESTKAVEVNARENASNNEYLCSYKAGSGIQLYKNVAGTYTALAADYTATTPTAGSTLTITAVGTTISCWLNGVQVQSATDSSISSGAPGIAVSGTNGRISFFTTE